MNRTDTVYLINSTPSYYYILELHIVLLKRYAPLLKWDIYLATEEPENPICKLLESKYNVKLLHLEKENSTFLLSRKRALELLPSTVKYVLPVQEDFIIERYIDVESINESLNIIDNDEEMISMRYMPCPGPNEQNRAYNLQWRYISKEFDNYLFTFQSTLWRKHSCLLWYSIISSIEGEENIRQNVAENSQGQQMFYDIFNSKKIVGYIRKYKEANAVYSSPFPYRPTAIIKGVLQDWAKKLAIREGVKIEGINR